MTDGAFVTDLDGIDVEALRAQERAYANLGDAVRQVLDAAIRTEVGNDEAYAAAERIRAVTADLLAVANDGSLGLQVCSDGRLRDHGNPAVGMRNGFAPPLAIERDAEAMTVETSFTLGAAYEGPPGHVHGGIIAMVLDQVLGSIPPLRGRPGMTAYLNLTYRRPTPLGPLTAKAWVTETTDRKTFVEGSLHDADGRVTVEAQALFVLPAWAEGLLPQSDAGEF